MRETLAIGLTHIQPLKVGNGLTVPALSHAFTGFADMPPVFATAFMVALVEWSCVEALRPHLEPHEHSVGTRVDVQHLSPTPVGMTATAKVVLTGIEGRMLKFEVSCFDDLDEIGKGVHERAIIDKPRFLRRVAERAAQAGVGTQA